MNNKEKIEQLKKEVEFLNKVADEFQKMTEFKDERILQLKKENSRLKSEYDFNEDKEKLLTNVLIENSELKIELEKSKFFDIVKLQKENRELKNKIEKAIKMFKEIAGMAIPGEKK